LKKNIIIAFAASVVLATSANASGESTCKSLGLNPSSKAGKQWEKIFSSTDKLKSIGADKLSMPELNDLKIYLINHAADSDHPTVPGK
jgi:hypothetical protein